MHSELMYEMVRREVSICLEKHEKNCHYIHS